MIAMILAATIAQVNADDFYLMRATEFWVMDNAPKPVGYSQYIPAALLEHVNIWREDCWRCRKRANEAVIKMGPDAIRWLFWPLRAKDLRVSMHAEAVITGLIKCPYCDGGECPGFKPAKDDQYRCFVCDYHKYAHIWSAPDCVHCWGAGIFPHD